MRKKEQHQQLTMHHALGGNPQPIWPKQARGSDTHLGLQQETGLLPSNGKGIQAGAPLGTTQESARQGK